MAGGAAGGGGGGARAEADSFLKWLVPFTRFEAAEGRVCVRGTGRADAAGREAGLDG